MFFNSEKKFSTGNQTQDLWLKFPNVYDWYTWMTLVDAITPDRLSPITSRLSHEIAWQNILHVYNNDRNVIIFYYFNSIEMIGKESMLVLIVFQIELKSIQSRSGTRNHLLKLSIFVTVKLLWVFFWNNFRSKVFPIFRKPIFTINLRNVCKMFSSTYCHYSTLSFKFLRFLVQVLILR